MHPFRCAGLVLAFALTALSTFAATPPNNIHGTITDPLGAAVAGAQVQLLREGKPVAVTITNAEGKYQFSPLAPGRYQIRAEGLTFAARQSDAVYLRSGSAVVNLALRLPSVSQEIVVSATGTQVPDTQVGAAVSVIPVRSVSIQAACAGAIAAGSGRAGFGGWPARHQRIGFHPWRQQQCQRRLA